MDAFFNTLKKGLVAMMFVVVGFSMTYVPQLPTSQVPHAEAQKARLGMQIVQNASALAGNAINTATSLATGNLWIKENVLDGIAWSIAKRIVSGMVRSLINWVNSGFQGSPAFVTDIKGFLLDVADEEFGRVISEIGGSDGLGSFICSPFKLDVQISLESQYARGRASGQSAPECTLSGVISNIEGFIAGTDPGNGLSDWLQITSTPQTYTPYGAVLNAEVAARARLINAEGQVLEEVSWGDGFLSQKICQSVGGTSGGQQCSISKPGRIIADQLNKALGAGQDALIEADELNELLAGLLGQLANKALTGVSGLLGLSGGTGYSYSSSGGYSGSYLDAAVAQSSNLTTNSAETGSKNIITPQLGRQIEYRELLVAYQTAFTNFLARPVPDATTVTRTAGSEGGTTIVTSGSISPAERRNLLRYRQNIRSELSNLNILIDQNNEDILTLTSMAYQYDQAGPDEQIEILLDFTSFPGITDYEIGTEADRLADIASDNTVAGQAITSTGSLTDLLTAIDPTITVDPTDESWINLAENLRLNLP